MGALCLATSLACYLAAAEPHVQMEILNVQLVPLLQERGISLCWKTHNQFAQMISSIGKPCTDEDSRDKDGSEDSEDKDGSKELTEQSDKEDSSTVGRYA